MNWPLRRARWPLVAAVFALCSQVQTARASASTVSLPPLERWTKSGVDLRLREGVTELVLTRMFDAGGLSFPTVAVAPRERLTFRLTVETEYKPSSGYYLFWLEIELLEGDRIAGKVEFSF